jgi:hypothetical protein
MLNKNAGKIHKNVGAGKNVQKHWRIQKPWCIQKHWRIQKPWRIQKHWRIQKPWRIQKHWRILKYWRTEKTRRTPMLAQQEKVGGDAQELPYC